MNCLGIQESLSPSRNTLPIINPKSKDGFSDGYLYFKQCVD